MEQEKKPKVVGYSKYEEVVAERNELKKQIYVSTHYKSSISTFMGLENGVCL
jgi:hypothetical protein